MIKKKIIIIIYSSIIGIGYSNSNSKELLSGSNFDLSNISYSIGFGKINSTLYTESKYDIKERTFSLKFNTKKGYWAFNIIHEDHDATYIKSNMYAIDGPSSYYIYRIYGFHKYRNFNKIGFSLGVYFWYTSSFLFSYFPLPYINFKIFRSNKGYFEITLLDAINILPYTLGYKYRLNNITLGIHTCVIDKQQNVGIVDLKISIKKKILFMTQYMYNNADNEHKYRIGLGVNLTK